MRVLIWSSFQAAVIAFFLIADVTVVQGAQTKDADLDGIIDTVVPIQLSDQPRSTGGSSPLHRMLIDRSHGGFFAVNGFTDFLAAQGWEIASLENGPVTVEALAGFDIFMSAFSIQEFTSDEVAAVEDYLRSGGGLWLLHDFNTYAVGVNSLSTHFGVTFYRDRVVDLTDRRGFFFWPNIHVLAEHPVLEDVHSYGYYAGCCLDVGEPAVVIASGDDDANSTNCESYPAVLAAAIIGRGHAIFSGDRTPLHPNFFPERLDSEEQLLLMNIVEWLSTPGPEPVTVAFDIKPGSCPNPLNVSVFANAIGGMQPARGGVLPVAVLGTPQFDVSDIDVSTLEILGVAPLRHSFEDAGAPFESAEECGCTDAGPDGYSDLTLKFRKSEVAAALGGSGIGDVIELTLSGELLDGRQLEGTDCITIVGGGPNGDESTDPRVVQRIPAKNYLGQNHPNPFNPTTTIEYGVREPGERVQLRVYDLRGATVRILVDDTQPAGVYERVWDGRDDSGTLVASGVYFLKLKTGSDLFIRKAVLIK